MTEKRYFALIGEDGYVYPVFFDSKNEDKEIDVDIVVDLLNENEQLKQRNDRQAKQLDRLYHLIEEKDWRTLTDILDDFKRFEEQLQREWRTYK